MRFITIQHKNVLSEIKRRGFYRIDGSKFIPECRMKAYDFMKKFYGYSTYPIFLCPEGHRVEMYGATFDDDSVAIELEIPDEHVKFHEYYDWCDFLYYTQYPKDFKETYGDDFDIDSFGKSILDTECNPAHGMDVCAATVDHIDKAWLIGYTASKKKLAHIEDMHDGSGGNNILMELSKY